MSKFINNKINLKIHSYKINIQQILKKIKIIIVYNTNKNQQ